jgi:RNA polymerase sigma factor (sigma-70 family)
VLRKRAVDLLRRYARGWTPEDREDMAQDVLRKVIVAQEKGQVPLQRFEAWFARVVHNVAINYWHARYGTDGERTYVPVEEINEPEDARQEAAIKEILAEHDMEAILNRTPGLQYHERASLKLICFYGFSYPHLANIFGVPQGTVRSWISRALDKVHGQRGKA